MLSPLLKYILNQTLDLPVSHGIYCNSPEWGFCALKYHVLPSSLPTTTSSHRHRKGDACLDYARNQCRRKPLCQQSCTTNLIIPNSKHSWNWCRVESLKEVSSFRQTTDHLLQEFWETEPRRHMWQGSWQIYNLSYLYFLTSMSSPSRLGTSFLLQKETGSSNFAFQIFL